MPADPSPNHLGAPPPEALNQPPPLADYNLFAGDRALRDAVRREGAAWAEPALDALGAELGGRRRSRPALPPTAMRRSSTASTASAIAGTRSSSIRPGTR